MPTEQERIREVHARSSVAYHAYTLVSAVSSGCAPDEAAYYYLGTFGHRDIFPLIEKEGLKFNLSGLAPYSPPEVQKDFREWVRDDIMEAIKLRPFLSKIKVKFILN